MKTSSFLIGFSLISLLSVHAEEKTIKELAREVLVQTNRHSSASLLIDALRQDEDEAKREVIAQSYNVADHEKVISVMDALIKLYPTEKEAYVIRALRKSEVGELDSAMSDLTKATELDPLFSDGFGLRGELKRRKGDMEGYKQDELLAAEARKTGNWRLNDCDRMIKRQPDNPRLYRNRAALKEEIGDSAGAEADRQKAAELLKAQRGKQTTTEK